MKTTTRSAWSGLVLGGVAVLALTGCRTHYVRTRTVYVPAPPPVVEVVPAPLVTPAPVIVHPPPAAVVVTPVTTSPVVVIQSPDDFYEPLAPYGRWMVIGDYGWCWIPAHTEIGWRPYANGYWQRTDAGWYWASDEPWGWATYHYGRWDFHSAHGWIWVPQTQWAPAWVTWREGGGYIGWAPLRPHISVSVNLKAVEYEPSFAARAFVFVENRRMLEPVRHKTVIVNNTTIINQTVNLNTVKVVNKTVINEGPRPEVVERISGRKVAAVPAQEIRHKEETVVVARKRALPAAAEKKNVAPAARVETRPAVVTPETSNPVRVEKPSAPQKPAVVATPPARTSTPAPNPVARPETAPARPAPARIDATKPAIVEKKVVPEVRQPAVTVAPRSAPKTAPEVKVAPTTPPRPAPRQLEKPATPKPSAPALTPAPAREEKKRETPQTQIAVPVRATAPQPRTNAEFAAPTPRPAAKSPATAAASEKRPASAEKQVEKKLEPDRPTPRVVSPARR